MADSDSIKQNIAENIVKYRNFSGLSQKEFAQKLGVGPSRVSNWENGTNSMDINMLLKICDILNVSINDMYGIYPDAKVTLCFSEQEHIKKYRDLDPHGKDMVDTVLDRETQRIASFGKLGENSIITLAEYETSKAPTYLIPYFEGGVSAGNGIYQLNDTGSIMMNLWASPLTKQADFIIRVSGDSMEPDYHDGDKVLVDRKINVELGEVGIFVKNGETFIKEMGAGELISRNQEYNNIPVRDFDNVVCLGKVIGILKDTMIVKC